MREPKAFFALAAAVVVGSLGAVMPLNPAVAQSRSGERVLIDAPPGFLESCQRYAWLCASGDDASLQPSPSQLLELARRINRRVNRSITQLSDPENYGVAEYWTLPANGSGDCEDFVLQKYKLLLEAGADSRDLSMAVVLDRRGNNHAVLVLRHVSGDLVLDSLSSRILPWNQTGYRFLAMQSHADKSQWEVVANQPRDSDVLAQR